MTFRVKAASRVKASCVKERAGNQRTVTVLPNAAPGMLMARGPALSAALRQWTIRCVIGPALRLLTQRSVAAAAPLGVSSSPIFASIHPLSYDSA